jgi:hypothetical protein
VAVLKSLIHMVRDKLEVGTLPCDAPATLVAGIGTGRACSVCGHSIVPSQTELQPQYDDQRLVLVFHLGCHGLWDAERRLRRYRPHD